MEWFMHRSYKLYELDGSNCKKVTGMSYMQLREYASKLSGPMGPAWFAILNLDAETVWRERITAETEAIAS